VPQQSPFSNRSIDPIQEPLATLRPLVALDCVADWSDRTGMVAVLLIAVCYAAGLAVHYRWCERTAVPSLSFDEPVDPARRR
jgi:hypothetical protein